MITTDEKVYRYFIQPQLDKINNTLVGYELLMKYYTPEGWRPPVHSLIFLQKFLRTHLLQP
ncbi:hypothetical protein FC15_GL001614 [Lapidilactobacillus concavus DSM 17758]|uniref:EAL domain-containing protein n=1 Tax=Lapidilactobacillus concavus DSM 17758 TaxID=1423735 RepID=A0A0R1VWB2_9LACO|nr:hypothetical protein [Lapidilactobacillus concavus]KRM09778.1 hypothetical protein FC15_GL001614 [Lapidilactobacillus concavus DSM 17758]GEL13495.1 hypothetical protein LCO01nite_10440 [Lapidilactobacillus concavus]